MRGRKPFARSRGNAPKPPEALPRCPEHLSDIARKEWRRLAGTLHKMGVLTVVDRAALAAYCQCYGRWVEAEQKLKETPTILKTPSGHVQQSPWLSISNKQLELMGRYMAELGLSPSARQRLSMGPDHAPDAEPLEIRFVTTYEGADPPEGAGDKDTLTIGSRPSVHPGGPRITRAP
ncbi:phage terminase small subunit P27 family, partial [Oceanibium sediminis]|uniref:phage terminase small subunit P27 family n=1 Tax=Oceanibium sediminis TaxID=2026339 RepID=UPI000DD2E34D